jgi:recombination protein RecT
MSTAVTVFESQLRPLAPHFAQVLPPNLPVERLMRTVVVSVERLPKLLDCDRQSLFNAAMSAACLGLEVDGVTGQAFLIPFKNRAQLVVGYKGYNTLAARAGITVTGAVVREGDAFEYDIGEGWITHKPLLNNKGRIIAAWAKAAHGTRPPVVTVLGIDDLMAVKAKSPGASRSDSPWNDTAIGFPAMCEKTAKRRLARSLPLSVMQMAARLDEAVDEQGRAAWVSPDRGVIVEGEFTEAAPTPTFEHLTSSPSNQEMRAASSAASSSVPPHKLGAGAGAAEETQSERLARLDGLLAQEAAKGWKALKALWDSDLITDEDADAGLREALNRRHKPTALGVDNGKVA